jgi:cytochrome c oxidase assembly protein subunit 15
MPEPAGCFTLPPDRPRGPYRLAIAMVAVTIVVILKGAMVTSTGSGMAFSDWPLSDGELMPARSLETVPGFLEHFHRIAGAIAGLLSLLLAVWVHVRAVATRAARRLALFGLALIVVQGVVGGVGVLKNLPLLTSVTHATLAQVTIATFAVLAYMLSARWRATPAAPPDQSGRGRRLAAAAVAIVAVQTLIGAISRHGSAHPGSTTTALWTHVANAIAVFVLVLAAAGYAAGRLTWIPGVRALARWLVGLLILQILLGFVALLVRTRKDPANVEHLLRAGLISTHVLVGALLFLTTTLLAAHVFRGTRRDVDLAR